MNEVKLNLARKWRSKQFSEIIGQELPVRMLKNSLYRDHYFPVYLFSGQRGCGKTTTARVFAAAVNCEQLASFQKNPKLHSLPCLQCTSCLAMTAGKHPDFIEIDAASHTGVDNVRAIIESSSLMPLMGSKKIYLIDEAHMLSKAAFNALLKIMEEPPASVLFILATTDAQKILDTVKSRCFQLFFDPVAANYLLDHLIAVCEKESIRYDRAGLDLIIRETEGSVRDALNMIEQVRFASSMVTKEGVLTVLGHLDDERLLDLAQLVITGKPKELLLFLQKNKIVEYRAEYIWSRFMALIHALLWIKYGVRPDEFVAYHDRLAQLARHANVTKLHAMLSLFSQNELLFSRTTAQHSFLEMILLQLCTSGFNSSNENDGFSPMTQQNASPSSSGLTDEIIDDEDENEQEESDEEDEEGELEEETRQEDGYILSWKNFIRDVVKLDDPLLSSIFQQGVFVRFVPQQIGTNGTLGQLEASFAKDLSFFHDKIVGMERAWMPLMREAFKTELKFVPAFDLEKKISDSSVGKAVADRPVEIKATKVSLPVRPEVLRDRPIPQKPVQSSSANPMADKPYNAQGKGGWQNKNSYQGAGNKNNFQKDTPFKPRGTVCNVSDKDVWIKANMLLQHFPGTVYELPRTNHVESTQ